MSANLNNTLNHIHGPQVQNPWPKPSRRYQTWNV